MSGSDLRVAIQLHTQPSPHGGGSHILDMNLAGLSPHLSFRRHKGGGEALSKTFTIPPLAGSWVNEIEQDPAARSTNILLQNHLSHMIFLSKTRV